MDSFTIGYVCFQAVVFLVVLGVLWKKKGWYAHTNTAASILTIVGVLGTFIGIFVGLQEFTISTAFDSNASDSNASDEIQKSISKLLEGLKFAFGTSIVGIGSALLLKGLISPFVKIFQKGPPDDVEVIDKLTIGLKVALEPLVTSGEINLSSQFDDLVDTIKGENIETRKVLDNIKTELIGEQKQQGEQTRNALTNMQSALIEGQTDTNKHLQSLTKTVSEENSETQNVLDSMKNEFISEQKEQGEQTRNTLTDIQAAFTDKHNKTFIQLRTLTKTVSYEHTQLRKEFETFSNNVAESITKLATNELIAALSKVIEEFNTKISEQFGDNFKQLNEAVGKTVEWQKEHRQNMDKLADEFMVAAESIEQSRVSLENIVESSSIIAEKSGSIVSCAEKMEPILRTMNGQLETFNELRQKAEDSLPIINDNINELTTKFSVKVEEVIDASKASIETQRSALERQSEQLDNDLRKNVESIRDGLEQALTESLNGLVGQLTSLSRQFVEDYEPLTIQLQRLVDLSRNVEVERNREGVR